MSIPQKPPWSVYNNCECNIREYTYIHSYGSMCPQFGRSAAVVAWSSSFLALVSLSFLFSVSHSDSTGPQSQQHTHTSICAMCINSGRRRKCPNTISFRRKCQTTTMLHLRRGCLTPIYHPGLRYCVCYSVHGPNRIYTAIQHQHIPCMYITNIYLPFTFLVRVGHTNTHTYLSICPLLPTSSISITFTSQYRYRGHSPLHVCAVWFASVFAGRFLNVTMRMNRRVGVNDGDGGWFYAALCAVDWTRPCIYASLTRALVFQNLL